MDISGVRARLSRIDRQKRVLEQKIRDLQRKALLALPKRVGLDSVDSLILALLPHASASLRKTLQSTKPEGAQRASPPAPAPVSTAEAGSGGRPRFSPDIKGQIKAELEGGKKSVAAISREYGPSHPTIMGWKREWGMTHPRPRRGAGNGSK
ncbi:MAG: hypothetical protein ABI885_01050 [Gammaproteobacteria bacterium]